MAGAGKSQEIKFFFLEKKEGYIGKRRQREEGGTRGALEKEGMLRIAETKLKNAAVFTFQLPPILHYTPQTHTEEEN